MTFRLLIALTLVAFPVTPCGAQEADSCWAEQSLGADVEAGATWGLIVGLAAGIAIAAESTLSEPESMGILLIVAVPLVTAPVGAVAGAILHLFGGDVPAANFFGIDG